MMNLTTHEEVQPLLAIYRDLDWERRRRVEAHLQECEACARELARFQAMDRQFGELREQQKQDFGRRQPETAALLARIEASEQPAGRLSGFLEPLSTPARSAAALASAVLVIAAAALFVAWFGSLRTVQEAKMTPAVAGAEPNSQLPESERTFRIDKQRSTVSVTLALKGMVRLSPTETVIPFILEMPPGALSVDFMEASRIYYEELMLEGSVGGGAENRPLGQEISGVFLFPALPSTATDFVFESGALLTTWKRPVTVTLKVSQLEAGGQTVVVAGYPLRFEVAPASEGPGFEIIYRPTDRQSVPFMLRGRGDPLDIRDDLGQVYTELGGTVDHDPENYLSVKSHTIRVGEPLSEGATQLTIHSLTTGEFSPSLAFEIDTQSILSLADYPPSDTPYYIDSGDFWLVHTLERDLLAFVPVSPEYRAAITVDECRYTWSEAVRRFVDPCSGDEWELDGRLNLDHSTELWSERDLDRYALAVADGTVTVNLDQEVSGMARARDD